MSTRTPIDQLGAAGAVSAASVAAAAVNQAVSMTSLDAPDVSKSLVARSGDDGGLDEETGLPLSYDKELIEKYWRSQGASLQQRWSEFLRLAVPFLLRVATLLVQGGVEQLKANDASLARDARQICEQLGPTFVKLAQTLSVRPDVLPQAALDELSVLQDAVTPFDSDIAIAQIEKELGTNVTEVFAEISPRPVAAASLAQVYKARLADRNGSWVAVKVQRPSILETVSKDLYVLRRAVEVYQRLVDRFAPQQKTNYVELLNEWAVGFYTELDFRSEMAHMRVLREALVDVDSPTWCEGVYIPKSYDDLCTARLAVTEWIDGVKLSSCPAEDIRTLTPIAQEAFLSQLFDIGLVHADPHAGNLLRMPDGDPRGRIALLDFGLVSSVRPQDRDVMVSSLIHLANRDWARLVDDFIDLEVLPANTNRPIVIPLMEKALAPYVAGGGAQKFQERVMQTYGIQKGGAASVGGFQAMTQDALSVLNDVPFSIPPYFALLGRAIITLEGIALSGDPDFALIQEAYPFVSRKLLSGDRPALRTALQEALYAGIGGDSTKLNPRRLVGLVSAAVATSTKAADGTTAPYFDVDALADSVNAKDAVVTVAKYVLSDEGSALRNVVENETAQALDVLTRQAARRAFDRGLSTLRPPVRSLPIFGSAVDSMLPDPSDTPLPLLVPGGQIVMVTPRRIVDLAAPPLNRDDELYALDLLKLAKTVLDDDLAQLMETFLVGGAENPFSANPFRAAQTLADLALAVSTLANANPVLRPLIEFIDAAANTASTGNPRQSMAQSDRIALSELFEDLNAKEREALRDLTARLIERLALTTTQRLESLRLEQ